MVGAAAEDAGWTRPASAAAEELGVVGADDALLAGGAELEPDGAAARASEPPRGQQHGQEHDDQDEHAPRPRPEGSNRRGAAPSGAGSATAGSRAGRPRRPAAVGRARGAEGRAGQRRSDREAAGAPLGVGAGRRLPCEGATGGGTGGN